MASNWNPDQSTDDLFLSQYPYERQRLPDNVNPSSLINSKPILLSFNPQTSYTKVDPNGKIIHYHPISQEQRYQWDNVGNFGHVEFPNQEYDYDNYHDYYRHNRKHNHHRHQHQHQHHHRKHEIPLDSTHVTTIQPHPEFNSRHPHSLYEQRSSQYLDRDNFQRDKYLQEREFDRIQQYQQQYENEQEKLRSNNIQSALSKLIPDMSPLELEQEGDILSSLTQRNTSNSNDNTVLEPNAIIPSILEEPTTTSSRTKPIPRNNNNNTNPQLRQPQTILTSRFENDAGGTTTNDKNNNKSGFTLFGFNIFGSGDKNNNNTIKDKEPPKQQTVDIKWKEQENMKNIHRQYNYNNQSGYGAHFQHQWWYDDNADDSNNNNNNNNIDDNNNNNNNNTLFSSSQPTQQSQYNYQPQFQPQEYNYQSQKQQPYQYNNDNNNDNDQSNSTTSSSPTPPLLSTLTSEPTTKQQNNFDQGYFARLSNIQWPFWYRKTAPKDNRNDIIHKSDAVQGYNNNHHNHNDKVELIPPSEQLFWNQRDPTYPRPPDPNFNPRLTPKNEHEKFNIVEPKLKEKHFGVKQKLETREEVAVRQLFDGPSFSTSQPPPEHPKPNKEIPKNENYATFNDYLQSWKDPSPPTDNNTLITKQSYWASQIDKADGETHKPPSISSYLPPGSNRNSKNVVYNIEISPQHPRHDELVQKSIENTTPMPKVKQQHQQKEQQKSSSNE